MKDLTFEQILEESLNKKSLTSLSFLGGNDFGCTFESGAGFTIMSLSRVCIGATSIQSGQRGFRAALRGLIGQRVESFENEDEYFLMKFETGVSLDFSNRTEHFDPPEAAIFSYKDRLTVWRGSEE